MSQRDALRRPGNLEGQLEPWLYRACIRGALRSSRTRTTETVEDQTDNRLLGERTDVPGVPVALRMIERAGEIIPTKGKTRRGFNAGLKDTFFGTGIDLPTESSPVPVGNLIRLVRDAESRNAFVS